MTVRRTVLTVSHAKLVASQLTLAGNPGGPFVRGRMLHCVVPSQALVRTKRGPGGPDKGVVL